MECDIISNMDLTNSQKKFLDLLIDNVKLNEIEWESLFGDELQSLRSNLVLRRIVAQEKISDKSRTNLIRKLKIEEAIKHIPNAIETIANIMNNAQEERVRLDAAKYLVKPLIAYLERYGVESASKDVGGDSSDGRNSFDTSYSPKSLRLNE